MKHVYLTNNDLPLAGMRVLVVEDNPINQAVARHILLRNGALADLAMNGQIGIDMLKATGAHYDAVLMDIHMPVLNGYEATLAIRSMGWTELPIVAMTAGAMAKDVRHAIEAGMNAHLAKPINVDALIGTLIRLTAYPARPAALPSPSLPPENLPGIDLAAALQRLGGNHVALVGLLKRFEHTQGDAVATVRQLLAADQRPAAAQALHRLRGIAANLGAGAIASFSLQAEAALRDACDIELAAALDALDAAMKVVIETVRTLPPPDAALAPPAVDLPPALAELLVLLQNNNLKALSRFQALRPAIERYHNIPTLAEAIETLDFTTAEKLLKNILNTRKDLNELD